MPNPSGPPPQPSIAHINEAAKELAAELDADVYYFAGSVYFPAERRVSACVRRNRARKNAILYLATFGGSADTGFRAARCLQANYSEESGGTVTVYVLSFCKSAGTLMAIGANELIMTDEAELGPLDVQISTPDSMVDRTSGLTPVQALNTLRTESFRCFEDSFLSIIDRSNGTLTTRTASMIATRMAVGLFRPLYAQLDPMRLGDYQRSMLVADQYGDRLNQVSGNLNMKEDGLNRLLAGYPSHEFVIDRKEAKTLFLRVRPPTEKEAKLGSLLEQDAFAHISDKPALVRCLSPKPAKEKTDDQAPGVPNDRLLPPPAGGSRDGTTPASKSGRQPRRGRKPQAEAGRNGLPE